MTPRCLATHLTDIQSGAGRSHTVTGPPQAVRVRENSSPKPRRSRQYAPYLAACENPGAPLTETHHQSQRDGTTTTSPENEALKTINSKPETFWNPTKNSLDTLPQPAPLAAISHRSDYGAGCPEAPTDLPVVTYGRISWRGMRRYNLAPRQIPGVCPVQELLIQFRPAAGQSVGLTEDTF